MKQKYLELLLREVGRDVLDDDVCLRNTIIKTSQGQSSTGAAVSRRLRGLKVSTLTA